MGGHPPGRERLPGPGARLVETGGQVDRRVGLDTRPPPSESVRVGLEQEAGRPQPVGRLGRSIARLRRGVLRLGCLRLGRLIAPPAPDQREAGARPEPSRALVRLARGESDDPGTLRLRPREQRHLERRGDPQAPRRAMDPHPLQPALVGREEGEARHRQGPLRKPERRRSRRVGGLGDEDETVRGGQPAGPDLGDVVPAVERVPGEGEDRLGVVGAGEADGERQWVGHDRRRQRRGSATYHSSVSRPGT